jgi:hypothetical protein
MVRPRIKTGLPPAVAVTVPVLFLAAGMACLLFATAWNYGPFGDEFYYIDCGRHLAAGYVDHPPLVAFLAFALGRVFGQSYIPLRAAAALAAAATVLLTAGIAIRLGGRRFAQSLAALAVASAPGFWAIFSFYSMNALDIVIVSSAIFLLIDALQSDSKRAWMALGVVVGIGLMNKLTLLPFGLAAAAGMLATGQRVKLIRPWPWLAGVIAGLIFLPNIIWQVRHGWPTLEFIRVTQQYSINPLSAGGYLLQLVLAINPFLAPLWVGGVIYFLSGRRPRTGRTLGILALIFIAFYVAQRSKVYYVFPIIPLLLAAGATALERFSEHTARRWVRPTAVALIGVTGLALLPVGAPVLPVRWFIPYGRMTRVVENLKIHREDRIDLPVHFALRFGWREMVEDVSRAYESLSPAEREGCAIVCDDYSKTGAVNYYRKEYGLPEAISGHNSYRYWLPEELPMTAVIAVGIEREYLTRYFSDVMLFDVFRHPYAATWETDEGIFIARGPTQPWRQIRRDMHWY